VTALPGDVVLPFCSSAERDAARGQLRRRDATLRTIEALAEKPARAWSVAERGAFPKETNGVTEPPRRRVARWASLFAEEVAEVHRLAGSQRPLSDVELQEVLYLAGRLLSTVTEWPIGQVDDFRLG
jgi:hypothetical protein